MNENLEWFKDYRRKTWPGCTMAHWRDTMSLHSPKSQPHRRLTTGCALCADDRPDGLDEPDAHSQRINDRVGVSSIDDVIYIGLLLWLLLSVGYTG